VALLWGDRWWISGCPEPLVFGSTDRAADALIGHFEERGSPTRLRLLFQSPSFASVAVECPNGNRATLQAALQHEYPALADQMRAWSYEPIFGGRTLLHFEREPVLFGLVETLQKQRFAVEGAWPLASVLNLLPDDWPETGALTAIAVADGLSTIFKHTPAGVREMETAGGDQAAELVATTIQRVHEREDTALYLASFDQAGARLCEQLAPLECPGRSDLQWDDVARAAQTLSLKHPNQLLPTESRLSATRIATGATVVAFVGALVLGALLAQETIAQRNVARHQGVVVQRLRTEVASLRENEAEIRQLHAQLAAAKPSRVACAALMRAITRNLPEQVVLTALHADRDGFRLSGGISGAGLTAKSWDSWVDQLKVAGLAWELAPSAAAVPTADFNLKGVWR
jgi:Tfp pilus assembly protein PilN